MSATLSAPFSAKKPIDALAGEVAQLCEILSETRRQLASIEWSGGRYGYTPNPVAMELKLREKNALLLLRGLRQALAYEVEAIAA